MYIIKGSISMPCFLSMLSSFFSQLGLDFVCTFGFGSELSYLE